jgi:hypothetical protein
MSLSSTFLLIKLTYSSGTISSKSGITTAFGILTNCTPVVVSP